MQRNDGGRFTGVGSGAGAAEGELEIAGEVARRLCPKRLRTVNGTIPHFELAGLGRDDGRVVGCQRLCGAGRRSSRKQKQQEQPEGGKGRRGVRPAAGVWSVHLGAPAKTRMSLIINIW